MSKVPVNSPQLPLLPLAGALASSTLYAVLLSTKTGRKWADEQTWATVVAGTALTLTWLATWRPRAAGWAFLFFAITGVPIVVRSLALQLDRLDAAYRRLTGE